MVLENPSLSTASILSSVTSEVAGSVVVAAVVATVVGAAVVATVVDAAVVDWVPDVAAGAAVEAVSEAPPQAAIARASVATRPNIRIDRGFIALPLVLTVLPTQ